MGKTTFSKLTKLSVISTASLVLRKSCKKIGLTKHGLLKKKQYLWCNMLKSSKINQSDGGRLVYHVDGFSFHFNNHKMNSVVMYKPSKEEGPSLGHRAGSVGDSRPAPLSSFSPASTARRRDSPPSGPTLSCLGELAFFTPKTKIKTKPG